MAAPKKEDRKLLNFVIPNGEIKEFLKIWDDSSVISNKSIFAKEAIIKEYKRRKNPNDIRNILYDLVDGIVDDYERTNRIKKLLKGKALPPLFVIEQLQNRANLLLGKEDPHLKNISTSKKEDSFSESFFEKGLEDKDLSDTAKEDMLKQILMENFSENISEQISEQISEPIENPSVEANVEKEDVASIENLATETDVKEEDLDPEIKEAINEELTVSDKQFIPKEEVMNDLLQSTDIEEPLEYPSNNIQNQNEYFLSSTDLDKLKEKPPESQLRGILNGFGKR